MMNNMNPIDEFPIHVLPEFSQTLIRHIQGETQAPLGLIASAVLGAMSLACQDSFDVQSKENLRHPVSLILVMLADSGERKSQIDRILMKPVHDLERQLEQAFAGLLNSYQKDLRVWQIKNKALEKALSKATEKGLDAEEYEAAWQQSQERKPIAPTRRRLLLSDVTSAAIKQELGRGWPSLVVMSDEAGGLLTGGLLKDPAINSLWSGQPISVERVSSAGFKLEDCRLGLILMVQPGLFAIFLERQGDHVRSSGFLARCLMCAPQSTQGQRFDDELLRFRSEETLERFHQRVEELLRGGFERRESGQERKCLRFSPEAALRWRQQFAYIESRIGPLGDLKEYRDYASKFMEHVSRIAAVIEGFVYPDAEQISDHTMYAAIAVAHWYFGHFIQQMKRLDKQEEPSNADRLLSWLIENIGANGGAVYKKNDIRQYCPNKLRSKHLLDAALRELEMRGCVVIYKKNRTTCVWVITVPTRSDLTSPLSCSAIGHFNY